MKKRKALIILPLFALLLSGCGLFTNDEEQDDEYEDSESSLEEEPSSSESSAYKETLSNYTLRFRLRYQDGYESLPNWSSLYITGDFNDNQYDTLVSSSSSFTYTLSSINVGTYSYRVYLFYNDETFDINEAIQLIPPEGDASFVVSGYEGDNYVNTVYFTLDESLETLLPERSSGGEQTETFTYEVKVTNSSSLEELTYDGSLTTQVGVTLSVKLITISSLYGESSVDATEEDVSISGYDSEVIYIDGLTVYPLCGDSQTSLVVTWTEKEVSSSVIEVKTITKVSTPSTVDNYTLSFTLYDEYNLVQECPDYGALYIEGSFDETYNESSGYYDWGEPHQLSLTTYEGHTSYSYTYSGLEAGKTYEYAIIFVYSEDDPSSSWNPVNHPDSGYTDGAYWESYNLYITIDTGALSNGYQHQDITNCYTLMSQYPAKSETKVYVSNYTLIFTIYDQSNNVQTAAINDSLYIQGGFDGEWKDEYGGYYDWGGYTKLEETTDGSGNVAYKVTYSQVEVGYQYEFNIMYVYDGTTVSWNPIDTDNFYIQINETAQDGDTQYESISVTTPIAELYPPKSGDSEYKVVFTFYDTNSTVQECPSYGSLYIQGNFEDPNNGNWGGFLPLTETVDQSGNKAYYYIFDELVPDATYSFNVVFAYEGEEPSWNPVRSNNFSMVIFSSSNETDTEYVSLTGCYTFSEQFGLKTNSCTIAVNDTAHTGTSLQISGDMQGWQATAMDYNASGSNYQYSYTFDCSTNQSLDFGIFTQSNWSDSLQIGDGTDATGNCTTNGNNINIKGDAIGEYTYTLIIFTVDGTNFGSTHVVTTAVSITH